MYLKAGRPRAHPSLQASPALAPRRSHRLNPQHVKYREFLRNHVGNLAHVLRQLNAPAEELDRLHQRHIELARDLATDYPLVADYQSGVGGALNNWASLLRTRGQQGDARKLLEEAVAYQQKALQTNPTNPTYLEYLRNHYFHLAGILKSQKHPDAEKIHHEWIATAWKLATIAPQKNNWEAVVTAIDQSRYASVFDCFYMAIAHAHLGKMAPARKWCDMGVAAIPKTGLDPALEPELQRLRNEAAQLLNREQNLATDERR